MYQAKLGGKCQEPSNHIVPSYQQNERNRHGKNFSCDKTLTPTENQTAQQEFHAPVGATHRKWWCSRHPLSASVVVRLLLQTWALVTSRRNLKASRVHRRQPPIARPMQPQSLSSVTVTAISSARSSRCRCPCTYLTQNTTAIRSDIWRELVGARGNRQSSQRNEQNPVAQVEFVLGDGFSSDPNGAQVPRA